MSSISGVGFIPRTVTNINQKNTINNNYKKDCNNVDSYTPMSFKGGKILKSSNFVEIESKIRSVTNNMPYKQQFITALDATLPKYKAIFINAKCTNDFAIVLKDFNENNAQFILALKRGEKELEHIETPIGELEAKLSSYIKKSEELCPTGGTLVKTQGFQDFVAKVNDPSTDCTGFIAKNKKELSQVIKCVDKAGEKIKKADCLSNISMEMGGLSENGTFSIKLKEETSGFLSNKKKEIGSFEANMYNIKDVIDNAVIKAEVYTKGKRDY